MPYFPWQSGLLEAYVSLHSDEFTDDVRLNHGALLYGFTVMGLKPEKRVFCTSDIPSNDKLKREKRRFAAKCIFQNVHINTKP